MQRFGETLEERGNGSALWRSRSLKCDVWSLAFQMEKQEKGFRGKKSVCRVMHIDKCPVGFGMLKVCGDSQRLGVNDTPTSLSPQAFTAARYPT